MSWKDLNIKQKAELIKLGVQSGIRDIKQIKQLYDDINTPTQVVNQSYNETNVRPLQGIERIKQEYVIPEEEINKANDIIQQIEKEISLEEINNQQPIQFRQFNTGGYISNNPTQALVGKVKKYAPGGYPDNQPISYKTWQDYEKLENTKQGILEGLAMQQYADNKTLYGDDVPEEAKYLYDMGLLPEIEVTGDNDLTKKEQYLADQEWSNYLATHPIQIGSEEYNRLPERAKAQVYKNSVTDAIDKAALPTAAAIIAPTALTAGAASLAGSGALTTAADAVGKAGTWLAKTNLGKAAKAFFSNPYIQMGLTGYGAYYIPQYFNSGINNFRNEQYSEGLADFVNIGIEGLGVLGSVPDALKIAGQITGSTAGLGLLASAKNFRFSPITNKVFRKKSKEAAKNVQNIANSFNTTVQDIDNLKEKLLKIHRQDLNDLFKKEDREKLRDLMDTEAVKRGYKWTIQSFGDYLDPSTWIGVWERNPSLLESYNLDHVKRYEDYNKIAQQYLSSNGEVKMVGSTLSNARGVTNSDYLANDIDFLTTKNNAEELARQYNLRKNMSGTAYINKDAIVAGKKIELNAQFIDKDRNGNAIGKLALEYFAIKDPKGYNKFIQDCIDNNKPILETPLPIKSIDLFNSITEDDILQRVILDNIGSGHGKHRKRVQRSLLSVDSNTIKKYKKALNNSMESLFGENYKKFTAEFPNIKFDDVEQNKKFLKRVFGDKGYDIESVANDPERMEVIAEMYYYSYSTSGRHTKGIDNVFEGKVVPANSGFGVSIINPKGSTGGGSAAGGGTNTGLGKAPTGYGNYESVFQLPITYDKSKINNLDDLVNQVEHITSKESQALSHYLGDYVGDDISYNSQDKFKHIDNVTREHDIPIVIDENSHIDTGYTGVFADADIQRSAKISELNKYVSAIFETPSGMVNAKKLFEPIKEFIPLTKWDNPDELIQILSNKKEELLATRRTMVQEIQLDIDRTNSKSRSIKSDYKEAQRQKKELDAKIKKLQAIETALYIIGGEALALGTGKYLKNKKEQNDSIQEIKTIQDTVNTQNDYYDGGFLFPNQAFSHKFEK